MTRATSLISVTEQQSTRRQHHVWRSYLKPWCHGNKIFCRQNNRIYTPNISGVAVERDFYKLHTLTDADILGIRLMMTNVHPSAKRVLDNFIYMFGIWGQLKQHPDPTLARNTDLQALIDHQMINAEEEFHARIEGDIIPILDAIRRKDLTFYNDAELCGRFTHFLSLQSLRTKGMREKVFARTTE